MAAAFCARLSRRRCPQKARPQSRCLTIDWLWGLIGALLWRLGIKLHPQQWNRMNRATRATRFLTSNLISRAELSNSDVEASSISLERLPHGDACRGWER